MTTKVQLISDIHLEFSENEWFLHYNPIENDADVLIIAGDFCPKDLRGEPPIQEFLDKVSENYEKVIIVNGNHDYYHTSAEDIHKENTKLRKNVFCVNRHVIRYKKVRYICATLWGKPLPKEDFYVRNYLYDFKAIDMMTMTKFRKLNELDSRFILREVQKPYDGKTVVVTHHIPSRYQIAEQYKDSPCNGGFASEEDETFLRNHIDFWVYGHTHTSFNEVRCDTHFLCNPLGYVRKIDKDSCILENTQWDPALYFEC
jgi:predicted phosphodiesterase